MLDPLLQLRQWMVVACIVWCARRRVDLEVRVCWCGVVTVYNVESLFRMESYVYM